MEHPLLFFDWGSFPYSKVYQIFSWFRNFFGVIIMPIPMQFFITNCLPFVHQKTQTQAEISEKNKDGPDKKIP